VVTPQDFHATPSHANQAPSSSVGETLPPVELRDAEGYLYRILELPPLGRRCVTAAVSCAGPAPSFPAAMTPSTR
jgi:hypothetical protein